MCQLDFIALDRNLVPARTSRKGHENKEISGWRSVYQEEWPEFCADNLAFKIALSAAAPDFCGRSNVAKVAELSKAWIALARSGEWEALREIVPIFGCLAEDIYRLFQTALLQKDRRGWEKQQMPMDTWDDLLKWVACEDLARLLPSTRAVVQGQEQRQNRAAHGTKCSSPGPKRQGEDTVACEQPSAYGSFAGSIAFQEATQKTRLVVLPDFQGMGLGPKAERWSVAFSNAGRAKAF
eukprot:s4243_g7.t1